MIDFRLNHKDEPFYLGFSGGKDSLAVAHLLKKLKLPNYKGLAHFNHGCSYSDEIEKECKKIANLFGQDITIGEIKESRPNKSSLECWWRDCRYEWFDSLGCNVITSHHISDCVEQYLMNTFKGCPEHKPIQEVTLTPGGCKIIRPIIKTKIKNILSYLDRNNLNDLIVKDETNTDTSKKRNWIRHEILPQLKNEGLEKVVLKKFYL